MSWATGGRLEVGLQAAVNYMYYAPRDSNKHYLKIATDSHLYYIM